MINILQNVLFGKTSSKVVSMIILVVSPNLNVAKLYALSISMWYIKEYKFIQLGVKMPSK